MLPPVSPALVHLVGQAVILICFPTRASASTAFFKRALRVRAHAGVSGSPELGGYPPFSCYSGTAAWPDDTVIGQVGPS